MVIAAMKLKDTYSLEESYDQPRKWKKERKWSCSVVSDSLRLHGLSPTRLLRWQSREFFRQEYWSGLPFPSTGDLPDPGIEPMSPALQADALPSDPFFTSEPPGMLPLVVRIRQSTHLRKIPWLAPPVVASDWSPTMFTQKPDSVICAYHWQTIYVSTRWGLTHLILLIGTI